MDEQANRQVQAAYSQACAAYGQMQQAYRAAMEIFNRIQGGEDSPKLRHEYSRALRAYNSLHAAYKQAQTAYRQVQLAACAPRAPTMAAPQPPTPPAAEEDPSAEEEAACLEEPAADQEDLAAEDGTARAEKVPAVPTPVVVRTAGCDAGDADAKRSVPVAPRAQAKTRDAAGARPAGQRAKTGIPLGGSAMGSPMTPEQAASARFWVKLAYVMLFLFPLVTIIFDYVKRSDYQGDPVVASHIAYQITTFWIGCGITFLAFLFPLFSASETMFILCCLFLAVVPIWCLVRIVKGFLRLCDNRPV